jgi:hypothetical protein
MRRVIKSSGIIYALKLISWKEGRRSDLGSLQARGEGKVLGGLLVREWEAENLFFVFW